jgi:hypothetical protein
MKAAALHTAPKKAKTRADRRAVDTASAANDEHSNSVTPQKKERRTAYSARLNDLCIKRAKCEKARYHTMQTEDEERALQLDGFECLMCCSCCCTPTGSDLGDDEPVINFDNNIIIAAQ